MPGQYRITFSGFPELQFANMRPMRLPARRANLPGEESLIRAALTSANAPKRAFHSSLLQAAADPPAALIVSGSVPGALIRAPREWTVAEGVTAGIAAGTGASVGGGLYFWMHPPHSEIGLFGSLSLGLVANLGVGAGVVIMILFGSAPALLGGDTVSVGVDVGMEFLTLSGFMILSAPPGGFGAGRSAPAGMLRAGSALLAGSPSTLFPGWTPQIVGIGFSLTAGLSALPINFSVMPGRTWLRPIPALSH